MTAILWSVRPYFPREVLGAFLPLVLFTTYAILSMTWGGVLPPSIQILSVSVTYIGLVLLTARECEREPALAGVLRRAMDAASVTAAIAYTFVPLKEGRGGDLFVRSRPLFLARHSGCSRAPRSRGSSRGGRRASRSGSGSLSG